MSSMFGGGAGSGIGGNLPAGVKMAAIALLAHQLMKHSQAEQGAIGAGQTGGGGLGGLLGGLLGQGGSASATGQGRAGYRNVSSTSTAIALSSSCGSTTAGSQRPSGWRKRGGWTMRLPSSS